MNDEKLAFAEALKASEASAVPATVSGAATGAATDDRGVRGGKSLPSPRHYRPPPLAAAAVSGRNPGTEARDAR
jgi:hypothetical protein